MTDSTLFAVRPLTESCPAHRADPGWGGASFLLVLLVFALIGCQSRPPAAQVRDDTPSTWDAVVVFSCPEADPTQARELLLKRAAEFAGVRVASHSQQTFAATTVVKSDSNHQSSGSTTTQDTILSQVTADSDAIDLSGVAPIRSAAGWLLTVPRYQVVPAHWFYLAQASGRPQDFALAVRRYHDVLAGGAAQPDTQRAAMSGAQRRWLDAQHRTLVAWQRAWPHDGDLTSAWQNHWMVRASLAPNKDHWLACQGRLSRQVVQVDRFSVSLQPGTAFPTATILLRASLPGEPLELRPPTGPPAWSAGNGPAATIAPQQVDSDLGLMITTLALHCPLPYRLPAVDGWVLRCRIGGEERQVPLPRPIGALAAAGASTVAVRITGAISGIDAAAAVRTLAETACRGHDLLVVENAALVITVHLEGTWAVPHPAVLASDDRSGPTVRGSATWSASLRGEPLCQRSGPATIWTGNRLHLANPAQAAVAVAAALVTEAQAETFFPDLAERLVQQLTVENRPDRP